MNTRLLRAIQKRVDEEPLRVNMDNWFTDTSTMDRAPECGTTGCIAGLAISIREGKTGDVLGKELRIMDYDKIQKAARQYLHLTYGQGDRLFHVSNWPWEFKVRMNKHREGSRGYAQTVSRRIDHFIETGGEE